MVLDRRRFRGIQNNTLRHRRKPTREASRGERQIACKSLSARSFNLLPTPKYREITTQSKTGYMDGFEDYDELLNRFATVYRDMDEGAEIRTWINLLPMQVKIAEGMARTEKIEAQMGLIETQKKLGKLKAEKQELENQEKWAMIQLYQTAQQAVERLAAGQAVEADFEVIGNLKQIGVKIPPKIKSAAFLLKQTNGEGVENAE